MSDPDPTGPDHDPDARFDDWPVAESEQEYEVVGTTTGGALLYAPDTGTLVDATPDESAGELVPDLDTERSPGEGGLGEAIEEFADEHGFDRLSAFARDHLESDDGN